MEIKTICVFAGSADHMASAYLTAAREFGSLLAMRKMLLVYGAGRTGLMGELANAALAGGGEVIGITPQNLNTSQLIHKRLTRLEISPNIQNRKARMYELADAFVALPGGFGTLDELFETLTWAQIGLHTKPVGILNVDGYYDLLLGMIARACTDRFIYAEHQELFVSDCDPARLLDRLSQQKLPRGLERWVQRQDHEDAPE